MQRHTLLPGRPPGKARGFGSLGNCLEAWTTSPLPLNPSPTGLARSPNNLNNVTNISW